MLGEVIEDRYRIEAELGEGAMGRVYRARHVRVGREVAIKVMHRNLACVPAIVERFAREAMIAARLRHPNLVSVLDIGTARDGSPLIVLELAPGEKLTHLIDGPQPAARVLGVIGQLLRGLEHAHAAGLVHRDLKPDNILVETTVDGREIPRIVDFGIAVTCERDDSIAGRRITETNTVIGTPVYMSPEQARAQDVDPRSDLFSLGVIAYEMLAGVPPFCGESIEVLLASCTEDAPSIRDRAGIAVDPAVDAFVRTLMARRPEDRFQSAEEALTALEQLDIEHRTAHPAAAAPPTAEYRSHDAPHSHDATRSHDAMRTHRDARSTRDVPTRRLTSVPRLTTMSPVGRRRALAGLAFALAAVVAVAGWSGASRASGLEQVTDAPVMTPKAHATEPSIEVRGTTHVKVPAVEPASEVHDDAAQLVAPDRPSTIRMIDRANIIEAASTAPTRVVTTKMPVLAQHAGAHAEAKAPAARADVDALAAGTEADSPAAVARRYMAVGKALRGAPDELWQRYRRIRINDALARPDARHAALATLAEIERALHEQNSRSESD